MVTIAIDSPERIGATFEIVDEITSHTGLVTSELVPAAAELQDSGRHPALRLARAKPPDDCAAPGSH